MPRLAVRKTPSKRSRYAVSKTAPGARTAKKTARRPQKTTKPMSVARIETLLDHMKTYADNRKNQNGPTDKVAKKLDQIHQNISQEIRKANPINTNLAKHLKQISSALRGVPKVPQTLRNDLPKLKSFLREQVKKDATKFITELKKALAPVHKDICNLENKLKQEVKKGKTQRIQYKADPSLLRKKGTMNNDFSKFKTKWFKQLNPLLLQAPKPTQQSIRSLKKQIEDLQKTCQRTCNLVCRYAKPAKSKPGFRSQTLFTSAQGNAMEKKFNQMQINLEKHASEVSHLSEQLKAIKQI